MKDIEGEAKGESKVRKKSAEIKSGFFLLFSSLLSSAYLLCKVNPVIAEKKKKRYRILYVYLSLYFFKPEEEIKMAVMIILGTLLYV